VIRSKGDARPFYCSGRFGSVRPNGAAGVL
jgi:hypothetical protein